MFGMLFLGAIYSSLWKLYTIKSHWVWVFAKSGSNVSYCKEYKEETSLCQRNCIWPQLYMLTFTCMNKSRPRFYYSIPARHHLWLSKKWNATETSDHPRGCATEAKRTHENIREKKYCSKTHIQRLFFPKKGSYNLDHNHWCRKNVCKFITAAKNNLNFTSNFTAFYQTIFLPSLLISQETESNFFNAAALLHNML